MSLCLCACVSTYNRPHLLPRVIRCFEEQDYENRRMLILDDGGQYGNQQGDRWTLLSCEGRYPSLGAKRNASIKLAMELFIGQVDAVLMIDDDDLFLPWHFSAAAAALEHADWSRPSVVLAPVFRDNLSLFRANYTGNRDDQTKNRLYHPAWAMRIEAVYQAGGYPSNLSGPEDQGLMRKLEANGVEQADPIALGFPPSYIYCWGNNNISGHLNANDRTGEKAWASLEARLPPATIEPWEPPFDLHNPVVGPGVCDRPF